MTRTAQRSMEGANSRELSIGQLSQLIAMERGCRVVDTATASLFGDDIKQPVTLEEVIAAATRHGYEFGEPTRYYPASKTLHSEWHLPIKTKSGSAILAFLIPLDVA